MTHTREAEVQKAREWWHASEQLRCKLCDRNKYGDDESEWIMLAAYAAHSLRVELGELAKEIPLSSCMTELDVVSLIRRRIKEQRESI